MNVDIIRQQARPDDTYLLCSDGLWSELTEEEIHSALKEPKISPACEKLVRLALSRGAPDNITGIMFHIDVIQTQAILPFSWRTFLRKG